MRKVLLVQSIEDGELIFSLKRHGNDAEGSTALDIYGNHSVWVGVFSVVLLFYC